MVLEKAEDQRSQKPKPGTGCRDRASMVGVRWLDPRVLYPEHWPSGLSDKSWALAQACLHRPTDVERLHLGPTNETRTRPENPQCGTDTACPGDFWSGPLVGC